MGAIASQITSLTIVYTTVYSDADQRKHQSPASLAFMRGIHRGPVNSPHKWPVTRNMFPFDDVILTTGLLNSHCNRNLMKFDGNTNRLHFCSHSHILLCFFFSLIHSGILIKQCIILWCCIFVLSHVVWLIVASGLCSTTRRVGCVCNNYFQTTFKEKLINHFTGRLDGKYATHRQ